MTHRSRSGGPPKKRTQTKKRGPKLHHPPAHEEREEEGERPEAIGEEEEDAGVPPASHFAQPTNDEVLTVLRWALLDTLNSDEFPALVQRAKGLLFERKWLELFTDPALLDAYAGRWVPSRALCFRDLMAGIRDVRRVFTDEAAGALDGEASGDEEVEPAEEDTQEPAGEDAQPTGEAPSAAVPAGPQERTHILSLGGGAGSELLAVAALASRGGRIRWTGVDVGAWGGVISRIEAAARDRWQLDAAFTFIEGDLLAAPGLPTPDASPTAEAFAPPPPSPPLTPHPAFTAPAFAAIPALARVPAPDITTLFFTLTELLSQNRARTVALLRAVTAATPRGGLLLVADSASDIAEFPLGKDGRTWPVYMVLDAIVGAISKAGADGGWEKVRSEDSRWFRLGAERWPCKLENARYWLRVYRRV
jgi:25S rRNA (uracil2843-N3)-methyltransferase